jgi:hypothetical protein
VAAISFDSKDIAQAQGVARGLVEVLRKAAK